VAESRTPAIQATSVSKWFGGHAAVSEVSFEIQPGEIVGLLGLNGAGKSTMLRMLVGALQPTSGELRIQGAPATSKVARCQVGYLPDSPPLFDELSVTHYLTTIAELRGVPRSKRGRNVANVLESCALGDVATEPVAALSHGYRQRVGLAQALVHEPDVVVLDEPMQGLDPMQIIELRERIRHLHGNPTVVLSTHILGEIAKTCDRLLVLHEGRLAARGTYQEFASLQSRRLRIHIGPADIDRVETAFRPHCILFAAHAVPDGHRLELETREDRRAELVRALVGLDVDLLGLRAEHDALEAVFQSFLVDPDAEGSS
jgi:ABC-2 type transport system ATP-binding protein